MYVERPAGGGRGATRRFFLDATDTIFAMARVQEKARQRATSSMCEKKCNLQCHGKWSHRSLPPRLAHIAAANAGCNCRLLSSDAPAAANLTTRLRYPFSQNFVFQRFISKACHGCEIAAAAAEIIDCGSFTRAAEALNVTQPTLTRTIQHLESLTGAPLLKRGRHGVTPLRDDGARLRRSRPPSARRSPR